VVGLWQKSARQIFARLACPAFCPARLKKELQNHETSLFLRYISYEFRTSRPEDNGNYQYRRDPH